jgi:hypothetical protein
MRGPLARETHTATPTGPCGSPPLIRVLPPIPAEAPARHCGLIVNAPSLTYIESDFSHADESLREYRTRTSAPRPSGFRRLSRRLAFAA